VTVRLLATAQVTTNKAGPPAIMGVDLIGWHTQLGLQTTLTPAYGGVDIESQIVPREGLDHQHIKIQSLDQHPKEVRQGEEVEEGDQCNAAAHTTADGYLDIRR